MQIMNKSIGQFISKLNNFNSVSVLGRNGISAKIIADSTNRFGVRLTTFELIYQRFVHSEFMTHRMFSKNSASSRAIPVGKMIKYIRQNTAKPIYWGKNQKGMQAKIEHDAPIEYNNIFLTRESAWMNAMESATDWANKFDEAGFHKQIVNRLIEPFMMMKVICSATEYDNFFWLRCHEDAQPEIKELANVMYSARQQSIPLFLNDNEYHLPYINSNIMTECVNYASNIDPSKVNNTLDIDPSKVATIVSASCCAQVSYRTNDASIGKAFKIYDQLVTSERIHASPFEHQARPVSDDDISQFLNPNEKQNNSTITHVCKKGAYWSGNFKGWIQHRHEIPNNTYSINN